MKLTKRLTIVLCLLLLVGCSSNANTLVTGDDNTVTDITVTDAPTDPPPATDTPIPTYTPSPTDTPAPTATPEPTDTPTPTPLPTATPTNTPIPTPTEVPLGFSRYQPYPVGTTAEFDNWAFTVVEFVRGDEADARVAAANAFNDPPPAEMEYVLLKIRVKSNHTSGELEDINQFDFRLTGSRGIRHGVPFVVGPEPELDFELADGGESEGWIAFTVFSDETDLILLDRDETVFVSVENGAAIERLSERPEEAFTDQSRENPVPFGARYVGSEWAIQVNEVVLGQEAVSRMLDSNIFNEPPSEGQVYVLANVTVTNYANELRSQNISGSEFEVTGSRRIVLRELDLGVPPEPVLRVDLFPGGSYTGWVVELVNEDDTDLLLRYARFLDEPVFFALEEGAAIPVTDDLNSRPETNDLGSSFDQPAQLGETVVTDEWQLTVVETIVGEEALARIQSANQFNDPPEEGFQYVLLRVQVAYFGDEDDHEVVDTFDFKLLGDNGVVYDVPSVVEPAPILDVWLYPQGMYEGWIALQATLDDSGLRLLFEPANRYMLIGG